MVEGDEGIPYPMLSDLGGKIGQQYNVFSEAASVNLRGTFIIDPEGVIMAMEIVNDNVGRKIDEIIRKLKAFQHSKATGEVIPADWEPGKKTLTPSTELAGHVMDEWKPGE